MAVVICATCGKQNADHLVFCEDCGARLQPRITRKSLTKKVLADSPAAYLAYDLLEADGDDLRTTPLAHRRAKLDALAAGLGETLAADLLRVSPLVEANSWGALAALREESRARGVEGLMLKERQSMYGVGRTKASGTWWKWKIDPYAVDAVLLYAQRGHGRRASLYTDFTFAVWDEAAGKLQIRAKLVASAPGPCRPSPAPRAARRARRRGRAAARRHRRG